MPYKKKTQEQIPQVEVIDQSTEPANDLCKFKVLRSFSYTDEKGNVIIVRNYTKNQHNQIVYDELGKKIHNVVSLDKKLVKDAIMNQFIVEVFE